MTEQLLQFIWKYRLFEQKGLATVGGEAVEIIKPGDQNFDSGADFSNARLKIGDTVWAGNVEIEITSSNWFRHKHNKDKSHQNTILLVCIAHDAPELKIRVIELYKYINESLTDAYEDLMNRQAWVPCHGLAGKVDSFIVSTWLQRLVIERLQHKTAPILQALFQNQNNWEETFYHLLARNFGFNTNAVPFELLAKSLPLTVLAKHKNSLLQIEALLLGQSGLLQAAESDNYTAELLKEYKFLAQKYQLKPVDVALWKFSKTRPANFPTMRIAQFAALIFHSSHLFSKILETRNSKVLKGYFDVSASDYWKTHYRLGAEAKAARHSIGEDALQNILINTVAPFMFAYGLSKDSDSHKQRALYLLETLEAENNHIIRGFGGTSITPANAAEGQALIQLYKNYCTPKKCLQCHIGQKILRG